MKQLLSMVLMGLLMWPLTGNATTPGDSIGVKIIQGQAYVMYKVARGDNLHRISRDYGVTVERIQRINELQDEIINVGQVLYVPARTGKVSGNAAEDYAGDSPSLMMRGEGDDAAPPKGKPDPEAKVAAKGGAKKHRVQKGETLYAISKKYKITVAQIKEWNSLKGDALDIGQVLFIQDPEIHGLSGSVIVNDTKAAPKESTPVKAAEKPREKTSVAKADKGKATPSAKRRPGVHVVSAGETLFGIAKSYGMNVRDLKVINELKDANIKVGQSLKVKADPPANPNTGTGLMDMMNEVTESEPAPPEAEKTAPAPTPVPAETVDTTTKTEENKPTSTELQVLTAKTASKLPSGAKTESYKDEHSGKSYLRVTEKGTAGRIEDFNTDQTKFYAFHKTLPQGSYLRVDHPDKGQSILVEIVGSLTETDSNCIRLSAKCLDYLMIRNGSGNVVLRYVIPETK